ncbi:chitinase [Arthrobacter sp. SORGH_AS 212]|nr:chitinase [Arthrobacter sp. SORGH_AS_0212]
MVKWWFRRVDRNSDQHGGNVAAKPGTGQVSRAAASPAPSRAERLHLPSGNRSSSTRLAVVAAAVTLALVGGLFLWRFIAEAGMAQQPWFSGYADVTVDPPYDLAGPGLPESRNVTLAFVVADSSQPCAPSWGNAYSLDAARDALNLEQRISALKSSGGAIAVSFGGSVNTELAVACQDPAQLQAAYRSVVERYSPSTIDFDIEGDALLNGPAGERRAEAVAALQKEKDGWGGGLDVWLTLPASPRGLTDDGIAVVDQMLAAGVDLAGVNIMTMNYGSSRGPSQSMLDAAVAAADSTHDQLSISYQRVGTNLSSQEIWSKMGLTPMIGVNDLPDEVFGLDAASGLNSFAVQKGIQRVSMWSLNRDRECAAAAADGQASHVCSGVQQEPGEFARVLAGGFEGRLR